MSEFEKFTKEFTRKGYKFRTYKKAFGERLVGVWKRDFLHTDRGILIYHFSKRTPSVKDFLKFLNDFEKFLKTRSRSYAIDGGYFLTYGGYDKTEFNYVLNKLDENIKELIKIKALKGEKLTVKQKKPKVRRLSQRKKERLISKVGTRCCYPRCKETITLDVHHIVPISEGGTNKENNLVVLCANHHRMARDGTIPRERLKLRSVARMKKRD